MGKSQIKYRIQNLKSLTAKTAASSPKSQISIFNLKAQIVRAKSQISNMVYAH